MILVLSELPPDWLYHGNLHTVADLDAGLPPIVQGQLEQILSTPAHSIAVSVVWLGGVSTSPSDCGW